MAAVVVTSPRARSAVGRLPPALASSFARTTTTLDRWLTDARIAYAQQRASPIRSSRDPTMHYLSSGARPLPRGRRVARIAFARGPSGRANTAWNLHRKPSSAFIYDDAAQAHHPNVVRFLLSSVRRGRRRGGRSAFPRWPTNAPAVVFPLRVDWVVVFASWTRRRREAATVAENFIGANRACRREAALRSRRFRDGIGRVGKRPLGCEETRLLQSRSPTWARGGSLLRPHRSRIDHVVPQ